MTSPHTAGRAESHRETYRRRVSSAGLMNRDRRLAVAMQRQGKTLSEIAAFLRVPRQSVTKALYWDVVAK